MKDHGADYTNTFTALTLNKSSNDSMFSSNEFNDWKKQWEKRIENSNNQFQKAMMSHIKLIEAHD